jgi:hypothetical protein
VLGLNVVVVVAVEGGGGYEDGGDAGHRAMQIVVDIVADMALVTAVAGAK